MPRIVRAFRGGDDRLLSGIAQHGRRRAACASSASTRWRRRSSSPKACSAAISRRRATAPTSRARLTLIAALGPFDVGQAAVVANNHVLAVEAAEGTDNMLARIAELRRAGPGDHAARRRRSGQGAKARPGPPLRSAGDRAADHRECGARRACRRRRRRRQRRSSPRPPRSIAAADRAEDLSSSACARRGAMTDAPQQRPLSIYLVAAEESGDALGAALARALTARDGGAADACRRRRPRHGGRRDRQPVRRSTSSRSSGLTAIPRRLPMILRRIRETADAVVAARPDALVIIDSPDFTHRVARRVRRLAPVNPDPRLRLAVGLGVAARARARHARLCRSACSPSCRSSRRRTCGSAARRAAMSAIR